MSKSTSTSTSTAPLQYSGRHTSVYDEYDYLCKLLVIGDSGCGKTCLLKRFSDDEFHLAHNSTIGVDFEVRTLDAGGKKVKMQMWDTAGQDRFKTITTSYYRGAQAVLIVFDVTQEESFANVRKWLSELEAVNGNAASAGPNQPRSMQILLIANKTDLVHKRVVESHRIQQLAEDLQLPFLETSAKLNTNVQEAFQTIAGSFVRARIQRGTDARERHVDGVRIDETEEESSIGQRCLQACSIM